MIEPAAAASEAAAVGRRIRSDDHHDGFVSRPLCESFGLGQHEAERKTPPRPTKKTGKSAKARRIRTSEKANGNEKEEEEEEEDREEEFRGGQVSFSQSRLFALVTGVRDCFARSRARRSLAQIDRGGSRARAICIEARRASHLGASLRRAPLGSSAGSVADTERASAGSRRGAG